MKGGNNPMGKFIYENYPYPVNLIMTIFGSKCNCSNYDEDIIYDIIKQFDTREQEIIIYRYEQGMTYNQIAEELDISPTRVSQLIHRCCHFIKIRYACHVVDHRVDIDKIGLSTRTSKILKKNNVMTAYDLMGYNKTSLRELNGVGDVAFKEIVHTLAMQGINTRRFR